MATTVSKRHAGSICMSDVLIRAGGFGRQKHTLFASKKMRRTIVRAFSPFIFFIFYNFLLFLLSCSSSTSRLFFCLHDVAFVDIILLSSYIIPSIVEL